MLDDDGTVTYANGAVERILGYEPAELVGDSAFDYVHPEDVDEVREQFSETVGSDAYTSGSLEYRFRAADDSWVWLESRMSNVTDPSLDGYVVSSRDVTDRVTAERECQAVTDRLSELSETTSDVLWVFNADWSELLFVNPAYESVFGRSVDALEADPTSFLDAIHPDDVPSVKDAMDCLSSGTSVDIEYRVNPEQNYKTWVWVQGEPIIEDGEVVRLTGFTRDITDRRRRERQLCVMDNLLRHNVRNDMGVILGAAELIAESVPETADQTAVIRETGEDLLESAEKQRGIIDTLTGNPSPSPTDLTPIVEKSADLISNRYPEAEISVSVPDRALACGIDELEAAVVELIENAVTHNEHAQPTVEVTVSVDSAVTLTVADDSVRIPSMEASVLTGDHEMDALYHSSGLGLWLIYWIVELSDGSIAVEAREGGGNRIRVRLPSGDAATATTENS